MGDTSQRCRGICCSVETRPAGPRPRRPGPRDQPGWRLTHPSQIDEALNHALARPSGGWEVIDATARNLTQITVRVVYRGLGPLAMQVDARFPCPDPRTVVMTIIAGDGVGSVVETHATPIDDTHTRVVEATLATSDRALFPLFVRARRLIRPVIERRADRLWAEDCAYAEQTFCMRTERTRSISER